MDIFIVNKITDSSVCILHDLFLSRPHFAIASSFLRISDVDFI